MTEPRPAQPDSPLAMGGDGWLRGARRLDSPHFDARPSAALVELLVIHCISLPPGRHGGGAIEDLFLGRIDPASHPAFAGLAGLRVSSHFLIARDGALTQFVSCRDRAWHAGESRFEGRASCNDFSLGVELEGSECAPFSPAQYRRLRALLPVLERAFPLRAVRGHAEIAPARKRDPGPFFDWSEIGRGCTGTGAT